MADSLAKALIEAQGLQAESRTINDILVIDAEDRTIGMPETEILFGVESDEKSERKYFECPRFVGDNIDLLQYGIQINYKNANDESDIYVVSDAEEIEGTGNITFSWLLSRKVTRYKGQVTFIVCATSLKDNKVTNEWNTTLAHGNVLEGLEVNDILIEQPEIDVLRQLIELTTENSRQAKEALKTANETVVTVNDASTKVEELKATLENTIREAQEMLDKLGDLGDKTKITYNILASEAELPEPGENGVIYLIPPAGREVSNTYIEYLWIDAESRYEIIGELPRAEIQIDSMLDKTSENAIQNKPVATQFEVLENNTWSLSGGTAIPEGADLNEYMEVGNYSCLTQAICKTLLNNPISNKYSSPFTFCVISLGAGSIANRRQQVLKSFWHGEIIFIRYFDGTEYGEWRRVSNRLINNLTTQASGKGALDASQGAVLKGYFDNRNLAVKQANTQAELDAILNDLSFYYSEYRLVVAQTGLSLLSGAYHVILSKGNDANATQLIMSYINYGTMILRSFYNGVWYERQAVFKENLNTMAKTLTRFIDIPDNTDMKSSTYIIPGCYMCRSIVSARTLKNCPMDTAFTLEVSYSTGSSGYIMQKFTSYRGDKIFCRMIERSSGVWSPAYRYDGNVNKTTIQKTDLSNLENILACNFYIYKQNNIVTIMINLNASMKASTEYKTVLILPAKYRPVDFMIENYTTQEGYGMSFEILSDGSLNLYNKNTNVSGWIVRKTITYFSKE